MTIAVDIQGRDLKIDDRLHDYVFEKSSRLDRYINGVSEVRVDLAHVKSARSASDRMVAQITVRGKGFILRAEERADDIYAAFDTAIDKIQRRMEKYKGKRSRGRGTGVSVAEDALRVLATQEGEVEGDVGELAHVVRRKKFSLVPMDENEAILQMDMLGHENFFVFYNANTDSVNVLYRRRDGDYGLIETEIG